MIIRSYGQGGQSSLPAYIDYKPVLVTGETGLGGSEAASAASSKSSSGSDLTDKDTLAMLKSELDGLPNDVEAVTEQLQNFFLD